MGSTLEHGIYLPSEGEKNCYQGLAGNWNKVDGALGDIAELRQLIENKFTKEIVTELPTEDINPYCIYMILKTVPETDNIYDEWVYINNSWEYLGNTKVDMTQYYTKQEVNQLPAVASGVTATKVGNYDAHIANGDIHVTASDKAKWTNSANTHVLRLALSALTPSTSDNSFSNLDDSTALKVGDKVMDTAGVLFEVTAIDTQNSTFTIGTALIDLAQDSDVVHKSGDETIGGKKTFSENITCFSNSDAKSIICKTPLSTYDSTNTVGDNTKIRFLDKNNNSISYIMQRKLTNGNTDLSLNISNTDSNNQPIEATLVFALDSSNDPRLSPGIDNTISVGRPVYRYKSFYGMNYYYGSNNVEFSNKFVTTDTNQTISETKTFTNTIKIKKEIELSGSRLAYILPNFSASYSGLSLCTYDTSGAVRIGIWKVDDNDDTKHVLNDSLGYLNISTGSINSVNLVYLTPRNASNTKLGDSVNKWSTINGVEPSALSLPNIDNRIDISSYITDLTGVGNAYTPTVNGWICIRSANATKISILDSTTNVGTTNISPTATFLGVMIPCIANRKVYINIMCTSLEFAYFIPCQGNV